MECRPLGLQPRARRSVALRTKGLDLDRAERRHRRFGVECSDQSRTSGISTDPSVGTKACGLGSPSTAAIRCGCPPARKFLTMRFNFLLLVTASLLLSQDTTRLPDSALAVLNFVAPPYLRDARDKRISGRTEVSVSISKDGSVNAVRTIVAHPVFESDVLTALKPVQSLRRLTFRLPCHYR